MWLFLEFLCIEIKVLFLLFVGEHPLQVFFINKTGPLKISQVGLELEILLLHPLSARIRGMHHHAEQENLPLTNNFVLLIMIIMSPSSISYAFLLGLFTHFLPLDWLRDWADYILILFVYWLYIFTFWYFIILTFILGILSLKLIVFSGGREDCSKKKTDYTLTPITHFLTQMLSLNILEQFPLLHLH